MTPYRAYPAVPRGPKYQNKLPLLKGPAGRTGAVIRRPDTFGDKVPPKKASSLIGRPEKVMYKKPTKEQLVKENRSSGANNEGLSANQIERGASNPKDVIYWGEKQPKPGSFQFPAWGVWAGLAAAGFWAFKKFT